MKRIAGFILTVLTIMNATSCREKTASEENPFFGEWATPCGVPPFDRIRPEHYAPAFERAMSLHDAEIAAIVDNGAEPDFDNVIRAYDGSGRMLARVAMVFDLVCAADMNDSLQRIEAEMLPRLAAHSDEIRMNEKLFGKIKSVYDRREALDLDAEQLRLTEKTYSDFVRSGALLDAERKAQLKAVNGALSTAGVRYGNNLLAETNGFRLQLTSKDLAGLPATVREAAREEARSRGLEDLYVFTLHKPSLIPFLTYASRRDLREQLYTAYLERCNHDDRYDNKELVNEFARLRLEKARLLGYESYADYVIADQMAATPAAVYELLDEVWEPAVERAREELRLMNELLQQDDPGATFEPWDWWYYAEKLRKRDYALDDETLRPYFSLANVQNGIFFLANRLYGITFRPIVAPRYHEDCQVYEVLDADESTLGVLYFDFYVRPGKSGGAWCGNFTEQLYDEAGNRIAPVVSIVTNYARPSETAPVLLNIDETETLFHEFGHALHALFRMVKYRGLSEVEGDFVELPSQVMENWAMRPEMLAQYAVNYRTGDPMPRHVMEQVRRSALFNKGFETTELVAAALTDLDIHSIREYDTLDVNAFEKEALYGRRGLMPQIAPRYRYPYFSHIFDGGYSAGYYFYVWAMVLDKDAFQAFVDSGDLFNRRIADDFRRKVLARGGSADGMTLYRDFRGADPDKTPLLRARGLLPESEAGNDAAGSERIESAGPAA